MEGFNSIGGRACPAADGASFEVTAPTRGGPALGRWARSGARDVEAAWLGVRAGGALWRRLPSAERRARLGAAAAVLARELDPGGLLATVLGLEPREVQAGARGLEARLVAAAGRAGEAAPGTGPVLVRRRWNELHEGLGEALFDRLAAGHGVVVLSDPRLPFLADRLAAVLVRGGVEPSAVSVLHDDGTTALRAALASAHFELFDASGSPDERGELERLCAGAAPGHRESAAVLPFGAGVLEPPGTELAFTSLERREVRVARGEDPERRARSVCAGAFGRLDSLSGQRAGSCGLVRVHPTLFSRFSAALLECLETGPGIEPPLHFLEEETTRGLIALRELGLDEGATLIHEGFAGASRSSRPSDSLVRLVFTNVEPHMRLAADPRPLPCLLLMRSHERLPAR